MTANIPSPLYQLRLFYCLFIFFYFFCYKVASYCIQCMLTCAMCCIRAMMPPRATFPRQTCCCCRRAPLRLTRTCTTSLCLHQRRICTTTRTTRTGSLSCRTRQVASPRTPCSRRTVHTASMHALHPGTKPATSLPSCETRARSMPLIFQKSA